MSLSLSLSLSSVTVILTSLSTKSAILWPLSAHLIIAGSIPQTVPLTKVDHLFGISFAQSRGSIQSLRGPGKRRTVGFKLGPLILLTHDGVYW